MTRRYVLQDDQWKIIKGLLHGRQSLCDSDEYLLFLRKACLETGSIFHCY
nr:hypothetical protein [Nostoc sp. EkiNYC01]